jgi:hypothetical protein
MAKRKAAHPYADLFPMMNAEELDALVDDLKENGLRHPIILYQDKILDGRNRDLCCEKADVEPHYETFDGDDEAALALVISLNVQRRDLTAGQRAIVAARRWMLNGDTKDKGKGPRAKGAKGQEVEIPPLGVEEVARQFHSDKKSVIQARDLLTEASDLAAQVQAGSMRLAAAYEELETRRADAALRERRLAKMAEYREAIDSGRMTFEQAWQKREEELKAEAEAEKAEADARSRWLGKFVEYVDWVEQFIQPREDERLRWYTLVGAPGYFEHGMTSERVDAAITQLCRARDLAFGEFHGEKKENRRRH